MRAFRFRSSRSDLGRNQIREGEKYEESASVLYENLIDYGYKNIYYVIDKNSNHVERIPKKYKKKIL